MKAACAGEPHREATVKDAVPFDTELPDSVMTNFDHTIDRNVATQLEQQEAWAPYQGWNFHGRVWKDRETLEWCCEVSVHHVVQEVMRANTLEDLMTLVSDRYGWQ